MSTSFTVQRLQHVSVPRPRGSEREARRFYGEALGLEELPVPVTLAHLDLVWYRLGDDELHLFASDDDTIHAAQHFCIAVDDATVARRRLTDCGIETRDETEILNRPRFTCRDPFGNLIEVTAIQGSYLHD
ncbi:MAG: VOC family protein [Chloroflexota bacterium]|nr:VOC family protein [Chloroflexota bacterium]